MVKSSRFLGWLAVPLIVVPAVLLHTETEPAKSTDGTVTMGAEEFGTKSVTLHRGEVLRMHNSSSLLHIVVYGDGAIERPEPGSPSMGENDVAVAEQGDILRVGPWQHLGVFHITCQIHPEMNLTVHVVT